MKATIILALIVLASNILVMNAQDIRIVIDTQASKYRIEISATTNELEFDRADLDLPSPGLCPRMMKAFLKNDTGKFVGCWQPEKGYSSAWMSSGSPIDARKYQKIAKNSVFKSESFPIPDVLGGLNHCVSKDEVSLISKIKLSFSTNIRMNGIESPSVAETDWMPMTDALRQSIAPYR